MSFFKTIISTSVFRLHLHRRNYHGYQSTYGTLIGIRSVDYIKSSSGCNSNQGCSAAGVCGPFLITRAFWTDAGRPVIAGMAVNDAKAYESCVTDTFCASETVRDYMKKFQKDCDGDGQITCEDYGRIHKMGPGACGSSSISNTAYYKEFKTCTSKIGI